MNALHEKADRYGGDAVTAHLVQQRLKNADHEGAGTPAHRLRLAAGAFASR